MCTYCWLYKERCVALGKQHVDVLLGMYYVSLNLKCNLIFNCRKSATCTHVSGLLHALVLLAPAQFQATPSTTDDIELPLPITSYSCKWKVPKKRKESNMKMSEVLFEKHVYGH